MKERGWKLCWNALLLGAGVGLLTMVCAAAGGAALMVGGAVGVEMMGMLAAWILAASGLAGALTARLGGGGPAEGALTALGMLVVLFALNGLLNGGRVEGAAVTALVLAGGCGAGLLLRPGKSRGRGGRRRKNRYFAQKRHG